MLSADQIQEWEYDFSPNPDTTICPHCAQVFITEAGVEKQVWDGEANITWTFCSSVCHHEFYLDRLRREL
jgi:hypothetical protein